MKNIRFNYLYRDGSNFRSVGEVVFSNPDNLSTNFIENKLVLLFLPDKLFIASQIFIPEVFLFIDGKMTSSDHCYHEFDSIEICKDEETDRRHRSILDFLDDVENASLEGWKAFDIRDRC